MADLLPKPQLQVNWLLYGDRTVASSRLQGYLIHEYFESRGVRSKLLMAPPFKVREVPWAVNSHEALCQLLSGQIAVFQKLLGPQTEDLIQAFRRNGVTTVYVHCDYEPHNALPLLCDGIVCTSEYLASYYHQQGAKNVFVVEDPAEYWCDRAAISGHASNPGKIRLCWIGIAANWGALAPLRDLLGANEFEDFELITVSDHPDADVRWNLRTVWKVVQSCDVGVVPVGEGHLASSKSSNRVVQFMAAGKPVAAGWLPAYEKVIRTGQNGYLCRTREEWRTALRTLRSAETRLSMARAGYDSVTDMFRPEKIGRDWLRIFDGVRNLRPQRPFVKNLSYMQRARLAAQIDVYAQLYYESLAARKGLRWPALASMAKGLVQLPLATGAIPYYLTVQRRVVRSVLDRPTRKPADVTHLNQ